MILPNFLKYLSYLENGNGNERFSMFINSWTIKTKIKNVLHDINQPVETFLNVSIEKIERSCGFTPNYVVIAYEKK